jgi:hypothetical protein
VVCEDVEGIDGIEECFVLGFSAFCVSLFFSLSLFEFLEPVVLSQSIISSEWPVEE